MDSADDLPCGRGFPIRTSADQRSLASPRGFSQRATSFIASRRQGIHRTPLSRSGPTDRRGRHRLPHAGPSRRALEGERTGLVPRGKAVARPPRPGDARAHARAFTGTPPKRPTHTNTHTHPTRAHAPLEAHARASSNKHNRSRFTCERTRRRRGVRAPLWRGRGHGDGGFGGSGQPTAGRQGPAGGGPGGDRIRTDDPLLAKQVLSRLSYAPAAAGQRTRPADRPAWAREDLNLRPHAYQACALTD